MKENGIMRVAAKTVSCVATKTLKLEANSASCLVMHQPKAPKELARFKK